MDKRILLILLLTLGLTGCFYDFVFPQKTVRHNNLSHNPVIMEKDLADPHVMEYNDTYYMYPTSNGDESATLSVYSSKDLKTWKKHGPVFQKDSVEALWAPDVYFHPETGLFYLYYTQSNVKQGSFSLHFNDLSISIDTPFDSFADIKIGVATSTSPLGPFSDHGVITDGIDANVFRDEDGQLYFYWTRYPAGFVFSGAIAVRKLHPRDPTKFINSEKVVLEASKRWESIWKGSIKDGVFTPITEGAFMVKENGKYYLLYSGGFFGAVNYSTGYAVSNSPLGPFIKPKNNKILSYSKTPGLSGPGHVSVVKDKQGEYAIIYHTKTTGRFDISGSDRVISVDKLYFDHNGNIKVETNFLNPYRL